MSVVKERVMIALSALLLLVGLFAPTLTVEPRVGALTGLLQIFSPEEFQRQTYSIIDTIGTLFSHGDWMLGVVLALFSVIFPIAKLTLFWIETTPSFKPGTFSSWMHKAGKFSMSEVMLLALFVLVLKEMPGGTEVQLRWGVYVFFASVLLSLFVSMKISGKISGKEQPSEG